MINLIPDILPVLQAHRLPGLDLGSQAIYPNYGGYSIANIPAQICRFLDVPMLGCPLADCYREKLNRIYKHVILVTVDGLGLLFFQRFFQSTPNVFNDYGLSPWEDLLKEAVFAPLTSVAPSTTSAALTSLWTGAAPAEHGIAGYEMWLKEFGVLTNLILYAPATFQGDSGSLSRAGFRPETFLNVPVMGQHFSGFGIKTRAFLQSSIAHSNLTQIHANGAEVFPYRTLSDLWVSLRHTFDRQDDQPSYSYVYWGDLDTLGHQFGPNDERLWLEFASFSQLFSQFIHRLQKTGNGDTLVLLTADHGQLLTPRNGVFELKNHPGLMDCLVMSPSGESRLAYLFLRPGMENKMLDYISNTWPGMFNLIPSEIALAAGLFGTGQHHARLRDRLGDWVAVAQGPAFWWWANKENHLVGRHGGVTPEEMLVPLVAIQI
jgi:hypothetical protein